MSWRRFYKTSWKRLEDVWPRRLFGLHQDVLEMSWRRLLKTYELGEYFRLYQDVLKMSWRRLLKTKTKDVFKTSLRRLHQDECLLGYVVNGFRLQLFTKVVYTDDYMFETISFRKAKKNWHCWIRRIANDWFKSYLTNRVQYVSIDRILSDLLKVNFGVPQGLFLGPVFFLCS